MMMIQMALPLQGTWHTTEKRGDYQDSVRPLPLPFALSYRCTLVTLDTDNGQGVYEIEIDDDGLMPQLQAAMQQFASLSTQEKRRAIIDAGRATEADALRIRS